MVHKTQSAVDYIDRHDDEMRVILGELVESAGQVNLAWLMARRLVQTNPEEAQHILIDAMIRLDIHVRNERTDSLRVIRAALNRFDAELPDDTDDHSSDLAAVSGDIPER